MPRRLLDSDGELVIKGITSFVSCLLHRYSCLAVDQAVELEGVDSEEGLKNIGLFLEIMSSDPEENEKAVSYLKNSEALKMLSILGLKVNPVHIWIAYHLDTLVSGVNHFLQFVSEQFGRKITSLKEYLFGPEQTTDDQIIVSDSENIEGALGDDEIYAQGSIHHVIFGDEGDDLLIGNSEYDYIFGNSGNDIIFGEDGDDIIKGGTGNDIIVGGKGKDVIDGDADDDEIHGDIYSTIVELETDKGLYMAVNITILSQVALTRTGYMEKMKTIL